MLMESRVIVSWFTKHPWSFTAEQGCGILLNNWCRWGPQLKKKTLEVFYFILVDDTTCQAHAHISDGMRASAFSSAAAQSHFSFFFVCPHLYQWFRRKPQCCLAVKLQKCFVDRKNFTRLSISVSRQLHFFWGVFFSGCRIIRWEVP